MCKKFKHLSALKGFQEHVMFVLPSRSKVQIVLFLKKPKLPEYDRSRIFDIRPKLKLLF